MTREETIEDLKASKRWKCKPSNECIDKAVKALEQQPEDAISRKKVIDAIYRECSGENLDIEFSKVLLLQRKIKALPPVHPKPRVGHWIYDKRIENWKCSECGCSPKTIGYVGRVEFMREHFKFCNHCGAKMADAIMGENERRY
ncbi:MAG: hypothetical protein J6M92_05990 [Oribacterium sp.]|nr:hypothetical protein [Oribacterium sp.]